MGEKTIIVCPYFRIAHCPNCKAYHPCCACDLKKTKDKVYQVNFITKEQIIEVCFGDFINCEQKKHMVAMTH